MFQYIFPMDNLTFEVTFHKKFIALVLFTMYNISWTTCVDI